MMQVTKVWWDGEKLMAEPIDPATMYKEPEQEPVSAECKFDTESMWLPCAIEHHHLVQSEPHKWPEYQTRLLYTTPPQRKPLTDKEIEAMWPLRPTDEIVAFARAIEAAHGIKGEA